MRVPRVDPDRCCITSMVLTRILRTWSVIITGTEAINPNGLCNALSIDSDRDHAAISQPVPSVQCRAIKR